MTLGELAVLDGNEVLCVFDAEEVMAWIRRCESGGME